MHLVRATATAMVLVCLSSYGVAQDTGGRSALGAWSVAVDPKLGRGCFASRTYESGTVFRIGLNRLSNRGYVAIASPAWSSLQRGQAYELRLVFGSAPPRHRRATAVSLDGTMTLWMGFVDTDLIIEFMEAPTVQVWSNKQLLNELGLQGSFDAFLEVVRCQANRQQ